MSKNILIVWGLSILNRVIQKFFLQLYSYTLLLADDYSDCPMQMQNGQNAPNIVELLSFILQTPEDVKGFLNFAVQMEVINVTDCRPDYGSTATCELLVVNPIASFTIQVWLYRIELKYFKATKIIPMCMRE